MIEIFVDYVTAFISSVGYLGLFLLMMLESTVFPLPSELVMPFAGFLVAVNSFTFWSALLVSTLGCWVGSMISYVVGYYGRYPFIRRFGKYFLLDENHLDVAEKWFKKKGPAAVFIGRFVPGVRHVIAIPAGVAKMDLMSFSLATIIGSAMWNAFLLYLGYELGKNWETVYQYTSYIDMFILVIVILLALYYGMYLISRHSKNKWKHFRRK